MTNQGLEKEIGQLLARQEQAWNRGAPEAHAADIEEDAWFTNILGQTPSGKTAFVERHRQVFGTIFRGSRLRLEVLRIRPLAPEVAMVETRAVLSGFQALPPGVAAGPDGALHTRLLQVLVKRAGEWLVAAYHNVDVKAPEEMACHGPDQS
jgi:uncharacterized protein (TIGR02246 family)